MSSALLRNESRTPSRVAIVPAPNSKTVDRSDAGSAGSAVQLWGVDWETYARLRREPGNRRLRLTYDRGVLDIMTLSMFHEKISRLIDLFAMLFALSRRVRIQGIGSATHQRPDLDRGVEPDQGYYIQHAGQIRGRDELDLEHDPPPDLVVEVDHTSGSVPKQLPIYAALGVPEVWRRQEQLTVHSLVDGEYVEREGSSCLPGFPFERLREALAQRHDEDESTLLGRFQEWLHESAAGKKSDGPLP